MRAQAAKADKIIIARLNDDRQHPIVGALRLCPIKDSWLLRSMSIDSRYQRKGFGLLMLAQIKQDLQQKHCFCFPYTHLLSFYQQAGFSLITEEQASDEIRALYRQYKEKRDNILIMQYQPDDVVPTSK